MKASLRAFAYLASALVTGTLGFGLLLAGSLAVGLLAVTPLAVPVLLVFRAGIGALADLEAQLARSLLGVEVGPQRLTSGGTGFWGRGYAVVTDRAFWRQLALVFLRTAVGWPLAVGAVAAVGSGLWIVGLPIYYRWANQDFGLFRVDTAETAVLVLPAGIAGVAIALILVRFAAAPWRTRVVPLLGPATRPRPSFLVPHALATAFVDGIVLVVWASVGGSFWPGWVLASTALPLGVHAWLERGGRAGRSPLLLVAGVFAAIEAFLVVAWALAASSVFWPVWPALGLAIALVLLTPLLWQRKRLERRISVLETTRAGAVDVQETELRRIERDLHDGAQARLVALGMSLGMAEQKLAADPQAARDLVAEARAGVEAALGELRDLARGIHPPVLGDRGLAAALGALTDRSPVPVQLDVDVPDRPPAAVETAAYFVAAEAIANAGKHADAGAVMVRIVRTPDALVLEVADDGRGGADPAGSGLIGLRRRVEALDGRLTVVSPPGGGTTIRAELPCAS